MNKRYGYYYKDKGNLPGNSVQNPRKNSGDQNMTEQHDNNDANSANSAKNPYRNNSLRQNYHNPNYHGTSTRRDAKLKSEETVEDIIKDISRIEKEIELEIKEIRSLRLGL